MSKIVVPLDGSPRAEQALGPAERLAHLLDGCIELVGVVDEITAKGSAADARADQAEQYLESVAERLSGAVAARARVIHGNDPAAEIIRFAGAGSDTFIVMSTRGHGTIGRLVFGSVADAVVRRARVPVVLVHGELELRTGPIQRIIVPLDGSKLAEHALAPATKLARRADATLSLVQVLDVLPSAAYSDFGLTASAVFEAEERSRNEARSYLDSVAGRLRSNCVRTTWEVRVGNPAQEIARAATTTGADLIVMATHGRTGLRRIALGSVTLAVVKSSTAPVLIVPPATTSQLNGAGQTVPASASLD